MLMKYIFMAFLWEMVCLLQRITIIPQDLINIIVNMWRQSGRMMRNDDLVLSRSIYTRKKSIQQPFSIQRSVENNNENFGYESRKARQSSAGKIRKNSKQINSEELYSSRSFKKYDQVFTDKTQTLNTPMTQKKNILTSRDLYPSKSNWFCQLDETQNEKIKMIEDKYRKMLSQYEKKKKMVSAELENLKSHTGRKNHQANIITKNISAIKSSRIEKNMFQNPICNFEQNHKRGPNQILSARRRNNSVIGYEKDQFQKKSKKIKDRFESFFQRIQEQIKCEETLRMLKIQAQEKKSQILEFLNEEEQIVQDKKIKLIDLNEQQNDPFFTLPQDEEPAILASKLKDAFSKCQQHWQSFLENSLENFSAKELFRELNFERKNEITLKALVRELGLHLERHYRNRDIFRIYERISPCTEKNFVSKLGNLKKNDPQ